MPLVKVQNIHSSVRQKRVSKEIKKRIVELYSQKFTTREVGKEVGFSKTTVHKLLKTMGINRSMSEAKIASYYKWIAPLPLDSYLSLFLGIHAGDGSLSGGRRDRTYWRGFFGKDEIELARRVASLINDLFSVKPKLKLRNNKTVVACRDRRLFLTLLTYGFKVGKKARTVCVPREILMSEDKKIIRAFLSGLLASDGSVYLCKKGKKSPVLGVEFCTVSHSLAEGVARLISALGYRCSINENKPNSNSYGKNSKYKVRVRGGRLAICKFIEEISLINLLHVKRFEEYLGGDVALQFERLNAFSQSRREPHTIPTNI